MVKNKNKATCEWAILIARLALVAPFVVSVFGKITGFSGQAQWIGSMYPIPEILLVVAILLELTGVISLILGYKVKYGTSALIIFTALATLMFHIGDGQLMNFLKNTAIIGGLITLIALNKSGKLALDNK